MPVKSRAEISMSGGSETSRKVIRNIVDLMVEFPDIHPEAVVPTNERPPAVHTVYRITNPRSRGWRKEPTPGLGRHD